MKSKKIAILGGGNIGMSIAHGFIKSGIFSNNDIIITRIISQPLDDIVAMNIKATHNNEEAIKDVDYVMIAVQPRQANSLIKSIKNVLDEKNQIVISTVTALNIEDIERLLEKKVEVVRIMPNTAISICESMTCLSSNDPSSKYFEEVKVMFDKMGSTLVIDEKLMAAATVLGACGTAFMLRFIRAASQGGIQVGFHAEEAQLIAAQVAKGAASLLLENKLHPEQEIDKVTTPMGLTIKGLNEMEHNGLSSAVIKGIVHSFNEMDKIK
jgi:pyrroline-5-carboxylate reductase